MVGLALCILALVGTFFAARRSLLSGIMAVVTVGYFFGIVRANYPTTTTFFMFDAAVAALYVTQLTRRVSFEERERLKHLAQWVGLLFFWPMLLLLVPAQDPMVQLVGFRAHVFLLPFLLFGAHLTAEDVDRLALWLSGLNLVSLAFAGAEFFIGLEYFYPKNPVTQLIWVSSDVKTSGDLLGAFRIPAIFPNSSAYGATMTITFPLLLGSWIQKSGSSWQRWLLSAGLLAAVLGVFLAASRTHALILLLMLGLSVLSGRMGVLGRVIWVGMLAVVGWVVARNERLFLRLLTLGPEAIYNRIYVSVNESFIDKALQFPLGNGLGGGGTSMPYFLQHLVRDPVSIENQYATFMLEMGLPGLFLWAWFVAWVLTRRTNVASDRWHLGRRLAWWAILAYFANGLIGIGFLTSVPFSAIFLVIAGWISVKQRPAEVPAPALRTAPVPAGGLVRAHA